MNKRYINVIMLTLGISLGSCSDFLSTLPDNRLEVKTSESVQQLLVSAYPATNFALVAELSSDNVQESAELSSATTRFYDQVFAWEDITENDNDSPKNTWQYCYNAINTANVALEALSTMESTPTNRSLKGEALLCRAYAHFILSNLFCEAYNPSNATQKLGLYYHNVAEKSLNPKYTRGTLAETYASIKADIEEGYGLLSDEVQAAYSQESLKFHFSQSSAAAFAARFYLYAQEWDKALQYASLSLGANPAKSLRSYSAIAALPSGMTNFNARALRNQLYTSTHNAFFLSSATRTPIVFGPYERGARYNHRAITSSRETLQAPAAWWTNSTTPATAVVEPAITDNDKVLMPVFPTLEQVIDPRVGTFLYSTVWADFTTDETLLVRAEAYIRTGRYAEALADMNTWLSNYYSSYQPLTEESIVAWNTRTPYSTAQEPTPRKRLNLVNANLSDREEQYLQVLLHIRRIETIHTGLRFFDIKRYGIEVPRQRISSQSIITPTGVTLSAHDPRKALQIPTDVIAAGMQANPR